MAIHELRWRCTYCGKENMGGDKQCQFCPNPRREPAVFYKPGQEGKTVAEAWRAPNDVVTDPTQLSDALAGEDWHCPSCGAANRGDAANCTKCGVNRFEPKEPKLPQEWLDRQAEDDKLYSRGELVVEKTYEPPPIKFPKVFLSDAQLKWVTGIALVLMLIPLGLYIFQTHEIPVTVTGFSWSRSIVIEAYRTVTEEGWSIPFGGRQVRSTQRISSYVSVLDHYDTEYYYESVLDHYDTRQEGHQVQSGEYVCGERDLGNGYSEDVMCPSYTTEYETVSEPVYRQEQRSRQVPVYRQDPIYSTWYTYDIEKWVTDRIPSSGADNHSPSWPEYSLAANERAGLAGENYVVHLYASKTKKNYNASIGLDQWKSFEEGQKLTAVVNTLGFVVRIKELEDVTIHTDAQ